MSKLFEVVSNISGGRISDERSFSVSIGIVSLVLIAVSLYVVMNIGPSVQSGGPGPSMEELEEYRQIQPF